MSKYTWVRLSKDDPKPSACASACGAKEEDPKPDEKPSACGAGDK